jgi:hypothetical protein
MDLRELSAEQMAEILTYLDRIEAHLDRVTERFETLNVLIDRLIARLREEL